MDKLFEYDAQWYCGLSIMEEHSNVVFCSLFYSMTYHSEFGVEWAIVH